MKKINKLMVIFILILLVVLTALYGASQYNTKKSLNDYWYGDENKAINASEILRCSFSLFKPDVVFVSDHVLLDDIDEMKVYFYKIMNIFSKEDDNREFIGVTTIENTTFPELVKMVKEDCSQFQKAKGDPSDKTINWSYSPYEPEPEKEPEPELTEEQIEAKRQQALDQINLINEMKGKPNVEKWW